METFLIEIPIPSMGATVHELTVIDIKVAAGAAVKKGEKIAELESEKSVFEFEAPCDGTVEAVLARAGDILPSGTPFFRVRTSDASVKHMEVAGERAEGGGLRAEIQTAPPPNVAANVSSQAQTRQAADGKLKWTPRALKLAREAGLETEGLRIEATGPGGAVSGDDVEKFLKERPAEEKAEGGGLKTEIKTAGQVAAEDDGESVCIAGAGYAVPKNVRTTAEILKAFPGKTEAEMIRLTGIKERRYADREQSATSLAAEAVGHALREAGMEVGEIDGIILATIIPDQPVPSMASALAKLLGIPHALAFDVNAACSGWLFALEVGRAFIRGGTARNVLVVTAELLSRITNPADHETAFLFGDGAGAAVLTGHAGGHRLFRLGLSGDARLFDAIQRQGGGARHLMPNEEGSNRDDFYLKMDGGVVFKSAVKAFADEIENVMKRHNLKPEDIAWVVPHQANERILRAVGKRVGIDYERFVVTIAKYGNTSGASVSMALGWAVEEGVFKTGDKIIFCSVGAGMTFADGLLVW